MLIFTQPFQKCFLFPGRRLPGCFQPRFLLSTSPGCSAAAGLGAFPSVCDVSKEQEKEKDCWGPGGPRSVPNSCRHRVPQSRQVPGAAGETAAMLRGRAPPTASRAALLSCKPTRTRATWKRVGFSPSPLPPPFPPSKHFSLLLLLFFPTVISSSRNHPRIFLVLGGEDETPCL